MIKKIRNIIYSPKYKVQIQKLLKAVHYDYGFWNRTVMYQTCFEWVKALHPEKLDVLEISAGSIWQPLGFKSYTEANFPDFDVCSMALPQQFDLIIADQVFEHLIWPYRAGKNVYEMTKPGGYFLVTTPFLIKEHQVPVDCSRWTELGMKHLLAECGFPIENIRTGSWGNRACVKANFGSWARQGWFKSLKNESDFPVSVWALAQK
ncbi:MAG: methyltransferase domain-containing protein [Gallionella sp.]|nr:methyltransferase domain-containing protein [Gallionella sp.]